MKALKLIPKLVLGLVALIVVAAIALVVIIDPNDYKPQIVAAAKDATGRDLLIEGDISWSFWPRLGFVIGHTELSNASGFNARVFAEVDKVDVGVQIMPLFSGKVALDVIYLEGMEANLEIKADGSTNWDDLAGAPGEEPAPVEASAESAEAGGGLESLPPIALGGVVIKDARVSYTDLAGGVAAILEDFNFTTGPIVLWEPIDFKGDFRVENKYPQLDASLNYSGTLVAKVLENQFALQGFKLAMDAKGEPIPNGAIKLNIGVDVAANTEQETAELQQLSVAFDETTIKGKASVKNFTTPAVSFAVAIDQLNADRYIPVAEEDAAETVAAEAETGEADPKIELPLQLLRDLNMDGELTVGAFQVMNLKTQNFKAVLSAHKGVIELKPLGIEMYQGSFDGAVKLDATADKPAYGVTAKLDSLQVNPLLVDFAELDVVEGAGAFDIEITTRGEYISELKRGLNGNLSLAFADGVLKANMLSGLAELANILGKTDLAAKLGDGKTTPFKTLKASATVVDGKVSTNDLDIDATSARITGGGSFDIPTEYLDMALLVDNGEQSCTVPLKGNIAKIDYKKAALGAVPSCAKDILKGKLDAEKARLKAEAEAEKQKAKAELERKKKEEEEKLKEKAKDKLKDLLKF